MPLNNKKSNQATSSTSPPSCHTRKSTPHPTNPRTGSSSGTRKNPSSSTSNPSIPQRNKAMPAHTTYPKRKHQLFITHHPNNSHLFGPDLPNNYQLFITHQPNGDELFGPHQPN